MFCRFAPEFLDARPDGSTCNKAEPTLYAAVTKILSPMTTGRAAVTDS